MQQRLERRQESHEQCDIRFSAERLESVSQFLRKNQGLVVATAHLQEVTGMVSEKRQTGWGIAKLLFPVRQRVVKLVPWNIFRCQRA